MEKEGCVKSFRSTFAFAIVVFVALFGVLWDYDVRETKKEIKAEQSKVFQVTREGIVAIEIAYDSGLGQFKTVQLQKEKQRWVLLQPVEDQTDIRGIEWFLDSLLREKSKEMVSEGKDIDWKIFGLEKPLGHIIIKSTEGVENKVTIGSVKAFDGHRYLRKNEEQEVLSVSSIWASLIMKKSSEFRKKKIFPYEKIESVMKITIRQGSKSISLSKDGELWKAGGSSHKIDGSIVEQYLNKIKKLKISEFASKDKTDKKELARFNLIRPELTIVLGPKNWKIQIGRVKENTSYVIVSDRKAIFGIFKNSTKPLKVDLSYFRVKEKPKK